MIIEIDLQSELPIYTQLIHQIIEGIASGKLHSGEVLPSIRSLAEDIGINLHTVNKAYAFLKQEGFIQILRNKSIIVQSFDTLKATDEYKEALKRTLRPIIAERICRKMTEQEMMEIIQEIYNDIISTRGESGQ